MRSENKNMITTVYSSLSASSGDCLSMYAGTRKMVNYACEGQSLRKLRWRLVAILTCKSFV